MNKLDFLNNIEVGTVFNNPSKGTSTISSISETKINYKRGKSNIGMQIQDFNDAYQKFKGRMVSTKELKAFIPHVFDSNARPAGHNCNCTFFFLVLQKLKLAGEIKGKGVRGNPFHIKID